MSGSAPSSCPTPRAGGHRCKKRRCPSCGVLWAGDTRKRLLVNLAAYGGDVALVTITAPGSDRLGNERAMYDWNRTAPARWRSLHRAARQRAVRQHGKLSMPAWSWEYQRRGALHKHVIVGVHTARERAAAGTYVQALHELRHQYDFGFVDRGRRHAGTRSLEVIPAERAGRYVAKYLSPLGADGKPTLSDTVTRRDVVPPLVVYVSRELTAVTGVTMRYLRHVRYCWVLGIDPRTGEVLAEREAPRPRSDLVVELAPALGP